MDLKVLPTTYILSPLFCFSKKRLFEEISQYAGHILDFDQQLIFNGLNEREKYGTTVFFNGIAIPHTVLKTKKPSFAILSILDSPINYNSIDTDTVSIDIAYSIFISYKQKHDEVQELLKNISLILSNNDLLNSIRLAKNEPLKIEIIMQQIDALLAKNLNNLTTDIEEHSEF